MNHELVPCQIKGCDRAGKYSMAFEGKFPIMLCTTHAQHLAKMHLGRGGTFNEGE